MTPSRYDDEFWELVPEEPGEPPRQLAQFVAGLGEVQRALDLGCGDGRLTTQLQARELTAADVSHVALERARRRLPGARLVELELDAPLPFEDGAFELVLCAETLEHVRDVQLFLSEVRRVLAPGGRLAIGTPAHGRLTALRLLVVGFEAEHDPLSPHLRLFTKRSLRTLLDELGFELESLRRRGGSLLAVARR
ncbi:MAG: class I SAM-dependent methyltransferase [Thermoleophilaceae bacterium]